MLFKISGIDEQGRRREISIDAATEADAQQRAAEIGITITGVKGFAARSPAPPGPAYPAIMTCATVIRILGWIAIVSSVVGALALGAVGKAFMMWLLAFGLLVDGIVVGVCLIAFAELLCLLVQLQANTQYMCERLYALERQAKVR